jgi:DNA repair ATPase RecN
MTHSLIQDVQSNLDSAERAVNDVKEGYVCDLESNLETVLERISDAESELRYCNDELEEQQDALDEIESRFGSHDPDDWDVLHVDDGDELRAALRKAEERGDLLALENKGMAGQFNVLQDAHEQQRHIIGALLTHFRELNESTSEQTLIRIMQGAEQLRLTHDE